MYIAAGQGQTTPGDKILMSTETSCHFGHLLQLSKKSLWSLILYMYMPRGRDWQHPGDEILMSTGTSCHLGHLLQVSKKSLWGLIVYNCFHDLIPVYNPGAGEDSPQGTKFWCQQKGIITLPICWKFQRNLFEIWFYTIFFHDLKYMYIATGQGQTAPRRQNFDINKNWIVDGYTLFFVIFQQSYGPW